MMIGEWILICLLIIMWMWTIYLIKLYTVEHRKANILQEQLEIRRQLERGVKIDEMIWKYHNVTYINNAYNIKAKNLQRKQRTLHGGNK